MDVDANLAIGTTLMCLSVPSLIAALSDRRFPLVALCVLGGGAALVLWVAFTVAGGVPGSVDGAMAFLTDALPETVRMIPHAFYEMAGRVISIFY
ncbi:hypothetical protein ATO6_00440 [Oceanicola sp. 22II-s10i]|uniref:hypothetical protein n=1 Tax=Oceanicola sp. 22II-s10i TaxID=1317116 RepID=UPI000B5235F2|nr:hypothetical protein [Oceanicola sp. 22II-s10i]OWU85459.1 hypothetical protein ATO6_00440 [Oceanicola sp. 22II-s10i]